MKEIEGIYRTYFEPEGSEPAWKTYSRGLSVGPNALQIELFTNLEVHNL